MIRVPCRVVGIAMICTLVASSCDRDDPPSDPAEERALTEPGTAGTSPSEASEHSPATDGVEPDEPTSPPALLENEASIDVDGIIYGLAIDPSGRVVTATREGRPAAYLFTPERDPIDGTPAALELGSAASTVLALGDGVFGLVLSNEGGVVVATPNGDPVAAPELVASGEIVTGGRTADAALALGQLWVLARDRDDDRGLIAVPAAGAGEREPTARLLTGPSPVELAVLPASAPADERLVAVLLREGRGELVVVAPPEDAPESPPAPTGVDDDRGQEDDLAPAGRVMRVPFDGLPMGLVPPTTSDRRVWVRRHDRADLLPIRLDAEGPVVETALQLPFVPNRVQRMPADAPTFAVAHGDGRVAKVSGAEVVEVELGPGTVELAVVGELLLAADPSAAELVALDAETLERRFVLDLTYPPGRLVVDRKRDVVWITVPTRQQVIRVRLNR